MPQKRCELEKFLKHSKVMDRLQVSLLITNEFKQIN